MENSKPIARDLLELAADYADYCVLVTTAELEPPGPQILYANSAFTRMTGYAVSDLLGNSPRILQGAKTDRELLARLKTELKSGRDFIARTTNYKRDSTPFQLEWIITHLKDSSGKTTNFIALQRDITGSERAADQLGKFDQELRTAKHDLLEKANDLDSAKSELEQRRNLAALGEVTAGAVHDISNALTPVFNLVQLLQLTETLPDEIMKLTSDLDLSIEHALDILTNLKQYHQSSAYSEKKRVSLREIVHRLPDVTLARWTATNEQARQDIGFGFDIAGHGFVWGNETELMQVMVNLTLNAMQAMPNGGTISIGVEEQVNQVCVTVADTGPGMSEELAIRCFEPYITGRGHGNGLGLAVCRRIIESHGGSIVVDLSHDVGTCFKIELPRYSQPPQRTDLRTSFETALLVGDQDDETILVAEAVLSEQGVEVVKLNNADEGIHHYFSQRSGLVIAQASLRPTSGFDLAAAIKKVDNTKPVVVFCEPMIVPIEPEHLSYTDAILQTPVSSDDMRSLLFELARRTEFNR